MRAGSGDALRGKMQGTVVNSFTVPQVAERDAIAIAYATNVPCRVGVKNNGGSTVFVGFASGDVQSPEGVGTAVWRINPTETDIFVLAPGQKLFAAASGPGVIVSSQVSEAFPYLSIV